MTTGTVYPIRFETYGANGVIQDFGNLNRAANVTFTNVERGADKAAKGAARYGLQAKKAKDQTARLADQFTNLSQTVAVVDGPLGGVASRLSGVGTLVRRLPPAALAATAAFAGFAAVMRASLPSGIQYEAQMLSLDGVLKATGRQAEFAASGINRMAEALDSNSLGDAVEIRKAAGRLLTFKNISADLTDEILTLGQDYSQVFGVSMATATEQLARVLDKPTEGFGRMGRNVSGLNDSLEEQVKLLVRSGNALEAQEAILNAVRNAVGGAGAEAAGGLAGDVDSLAQAWRRLTESIGSSDFSKGVSEFFVGGLTEALNIITRLSDDDLTKQIRELETLGEAYERFVQSLADRPEGDLTQDELDDYVEYKEKIEDLNAELERLRELQRDVQEIPQGIAALQDIIATDDLLDNTRRTLQDRLNDSTLSDDDLRIRKAGLDAVTLAQKEQLNLTLDQIDAVRELAEEIEKQVIANEKLAKDEKQKRDDLEEKVTKSREFIEEQEKTIRLLQEEVANGKDARDNLEDRLKIEREISQDLLPEAIANQKQIIDLEKEAADNKARQAEEQRELLRLQRESSRELERQRREEERFRRNVLNDLFLGGSGGLGRTLTRNAVNSLGDALFSSGGGRNGFGEAITQSVDPNAPGFGVQAVNGVNGRSSGGGLPLGGAFDLDFGVLGDVFKGVKSPFNLSGLNGVLGNIGLGNLIGRIPGFGNTGATVGAIVGSIIPGVGNVVGGLLGGLFGGLFGSKAPPKGGTVVSTDQFGGLDTSRGFNYKDKDGSLLQAAQSLGDGVISVIAELANAINVDLAKNFNVGSIGVIDGKYTFEETAFSQEKFAFDNSQRFDTAEEAVTAAIVSAVQRGVFIGLSEKSQSILASATAETIDRAFQQVEFIETVPQQIRDRIQAIEDPLGFALEQIDREFEKLRKQYTDLGLDTSDLSRLQELERQQAIESISAGAGGSSVFEDFLFNLTGSTQSPLSAKSRFETADFEFQALAETLRAGGTVDARDFTTLANARLSATSDRFGQGREFFEVFNEVTALTEMAIQREQEEVNRRIEEANRLTEAVDDQTEQVVAELDRSNQTLEDILRELREGGFASAYGFGGLVNFNGLIPQ